MEYKALTIAGFDGSGGAGIQADLKTFSALGCYGTSVLTALPIQNTEGVRNIYDLPLACIEEQIICILEDIKIDAVKIGMLHSPQIINSVATILATSEVKHIVVDPVMVAKSSHRLLQHDAIIALKTQLLPLATIITPNIPEAQELLGYKILDKSTIEKAAKDLLKLGCKSVLLKGGHLTSKSETVDDFFISHGYQEWFSGQRIYTRNTHGTGCTLSSAIAALLAQDTPLVEAVSIAKLYIGKAIEHGAKYQVGKGRGPVHHFFHYWPSLNRNKVAL